MASKEPLWMKNVQAQDINVDVLSSIFQTRKVSRQRRPGQAATENTVILRFFLQITSAVRYLRGDTVTKLMASSAGLLSAIRLTCRCHHTVPNQLQKARDAPAFIEYDTSHSARDANTLNNLTQG